MEINTHNADILLSAANKSHYPQDEIPEVALAGRSNVGKSSFINTLLNRKNLARTSGWMYLVMAMHVSLKKSGRSGGA